MSYFLDFLHGRQITKVLQTNEKFILPSSRKNEVIKFVEKGLKDLSVGRTSFTWAYQYLKITNMLFMFG